MTALATREVVRAREQACDALYDVKTAIDDVASLSEVSEFGIDISAKEEGKTATISFVLALPPCVVLAGLRAMEHALSVEAGLVEVA